MRDKSLSHLNKRFAERNHPMSNTITIKPTSPNKQNYKFVDVVDSISRAATVMDIAPRVRFARIDGVGTLILDKAFIDGITLVSLKKDEVATITTDAELSYKDTYLVTGYGLGRGVDYIELVKG